MSITVCAPVTGAGTVGGGWGRAPRVAVATVDGGEITSWQEYDVGWDVAHDQGAEGTHHARIAKFLIEHKVRAVVTGHMGGGMQHMLDRMGIAVHMGAGGDAREAIRGAIAG